jgi:hypothetical protein
MEKPQRDNSAEDSKELFDAAVILPDDNIDLNDNSDFNDYPVRVTTPKTRFTELRRRIEERLDNKRIEHEFDYDELDAMLDSIS